MNLNGNPTNPGEMRTQITLQKRTVTTSAGGFDVPGWQDQATVWAKWTNVHGSESWQAQAVGALAPATVLIRYNAQIDTTWAVLKGGKRYEVTSIDDIQERHEFMELKVKLFREG